MELIAMERLRCSSRMAKIKNNTSTVAYYKNMKPQYKMTFVAYTEDNEHATAGQHIK